MRRNHNLVRLRARKKRLNPGVAIMKNQELNAHGCPLRNQNGDSSIKNFAAIIDRLSPELRRAFEDERRQRRAEYEQHVKRFGYRT